MINNLSDDDGFDDLNLSQYLDEIEELAEDVEHTDEDKVARNAKGVSNNHNQRAKKVEKSFLDGIAVISKFYIACLNRC